MEHLYGNTHLEYIRMNIIKQFIPHDTEHRANTLSAYFKNMVYRFIQSFRLLREMFLVKMFSKLYG